MKKKIIFLIFLSIFYLENNFASDIKIIVKVDNAIITNHDINKEINYLEILNPGFSQLNLNQKTIIAKNSLIKETIKKKEVEKFKNLKNNTQLIEDYIKDLYLKLGFVDKQSFENKLKQKKNYDISEIMEKIKIEFLWNELIYIKYIDQVKVDKDKIKNQVNEIKKNTEREYQLSEIVFKKKKNLPIEKLYEEIELSIKEIGFNNTANIYSISDSSKFGGKIGWFSEISLSEMIKKELDVLKIGETTSLLKVDNRFLILKIENIKNQKIEINKDKEIKKLINFETNKKLSKFSKIYFEKSKLNYSVNEK